MVEFMLFVNLKKILVKVWDNCYGVGFVIEFMKELEGELLLNIFFVGVNV